MEVHQASEQGFGGKLADAYNAGRCVDVCGKCDVVILCDAV